MDLDGDGGHCLLCVVVGEVLTVVVALGGLQTLVLLFDRIQDDGRQQFVILKEPCEMETLKLNKTGSKLVILNQLSLLSNHFLR